jgi:fatty acid desaturase
VANGIRSSGGQGAEIPTLVAIAAFWLILAVTLALGARLPAVAGVAVLAILGGFYMSLQHEAIHGHPTRWPRLNKILVGLPLGLVEPFGRYCETHLAHHASDLTNPVGTDSAYDPESYYVSPDAWALAGRLHRLVLRANRTLAFRLIFGPIRSAARVLADEARQLRRRRAVRARCAAHVVGVAGIIAVVDASPLPLWMYLLGFVFGGASLTALRSFVEHSGQAIGSRTAVVRSNWFFSLLYLNNNLHFTHHALPGASWYRLPQLTRDLDAPAVVADSAGYFRGYFSIARRFAFRPFCQPVSPLLQTSATRAHE